MSRGIRGTTMILDNNSDAPTYLNEDFFRTALEDGLGEQRVDIKKIIFTESNANDRKSAGTARIQIF